jgi:hypothetical protein
MADMGSPLAKSTAAIHGGSCHLAWSAETSFIYRPTRYLGRLIEGFIQLVTRK